MNKFDLVKFYYFNNIWSIEEVKIAVVKNWITQEEFKAITFQDYTPPSTIPSGGNSGPSSSDEQIIYIDYLGSGESDNVGSLSDWNYIEECATNIHEYSSDEPMPKIILRIPYGTEINTLEPTLLGTEELGSSITLKQDLEIPLTYIYNEHHMVGAALFGYNEYGPSLINVDIWYHTEAEENTEILYNEIHLNLIQDIVKFIGYAAHPILSQIEEVLLAYQTTISQNQSNIEYLANALEIQLPSPEEDPEQEPEVS